MVEFRDDAPGDGRANSGVQVRFPALSGPVEGCPTTFDGAEKNNLSWIAVSCGHEVQTNDSPEGGSNDPRKTGSVYGFADIGLDRAMPTPKGTWNTYEVRVVGQERRLRETSVDAGTATLFVTGADGETVVVDTPYAGVSCGRRRRPDTPSGRAEVRLWEDTPRSPGAYAA